MNFSILFRSHPFLIIGGLIITSLVLIGYLTSPSKEEKEEEEKEKNKKIQKNHLRFKNYLSNLSDDELRMLYSYYELNQLPEDYYEQNDFIYRRENINIEYDKRFNIK